MHARMPPTTLAEALARIEVLDGVIEAACAAHNTSASVTVDLLAKRRAHDAFAAAYHVAYPPPLDPDAPTDHHDDCINCGAKAGKACQPWCDA